MDKTINVTLSKRIEFSLPPPPLLLALIMFLAQFPGCCTCSASSNCHLPPSSTHCHCWQKGFPHNCLFLVAQQKKKRENSNGIRADKSQGDIKVRKERREVRGKAREKYVKNSRRNESKVSSFILELYLRINREQKENT